MRTHLIQKRLYLAVLLACAAFVLLPGAALAQNISLAFSPPKSVEAGSSWDISGSVIGAEDMASAQCRYRTEATGKWEQVSMVLEYDDFFRARVPGKDIVPPVIEFYCIAKDYFGGRYDILGSANSPERLKVTEASKTKPAPAAPKAPAASDETSDEPGMTPDEAFDSADDENSGAGDDDFAAEAARSARKAMADGGKSADENSAQPMEIVPSEPTGSDDGIQSSFGHRSAQGPRVQEFPAQDLAAGETPADDEAGGVTPPSSELSSSKNIRTKTQRTVADFSPEEPATLYGAEDVVSIASNKSETVTLAPAIASGVSEDQMRDIGLLTLPDVLKTIPGMETSRDVQGFHRVAIRGIFDDAALLVMYDGHRLNNAYDSKAMLNLSTENLEQVEVLRGPGSALHGSGATLGTINLLPKRRTGIHASAMGGLQGTAEAHFSGGVRFGQSNWYLYGDASYRRTDGYREEITQDTASETMEKAGKKDSEEPAGITDDHGQWVNAGLELRRSRAGGGTTRAFARVLYEDRGALVGLYDIVGTDSELSWLAILADVTHFQPFSIGNLNLRLFFDHQSVDRRFQVAPKGYPIGGTFADAGLFEETKHTTQSFGFDASMDFKLGKTNRLTAGITGEMQRLPSYEYTHNTKDGGEMVPAFEAPLQSYSEIRSRLVGAVLLQDFWQIHPTFSLTLGLRLDVTQLPKAAEIGEQVVPDGTRFVPSINPRIGLVWSPAANWTLKLLYGRAFRAPTMQELSDQITDNSLTQGRNEGNPALRPATIDTVEASVETTLSVGLSRLRIRANGFFNHLSDAIMAVDETGNVSPLENREFGVRVFGAEGELRFEFTGSRAYTFVNCSWFRAEDLGVTDGLQYLTNVPQLRFNWAAMLPIGPYLNFSLLAQYGAERRNNTRSVLEAQRSYKIPPYIIVGAQLSTQRLANLVEFALTAKNVFNFKTFDEVPRPDSGRMPGLLPREGFSAYLTARFFY